jgi:hypothetical protein
VEATGSGLSEGDVFKTGGGCFEAAEEGGQGTDTCSLRGVETVSESLEGVEMGVSDLEREYQQHRKKPLRGKSDEKEEEKAWQREVGLVDEISRYVRRIGGMTG